MLIKFLDSIATRLIVSVTVVATVIASLSAYILFDRTYSSELERNRTNLEHLVQAVSHTAAIASYLEDGVLAKEVVNGISSNHLAKAVELKTQDRVIASSGNMTGINNENLMRFSLNSPFVENDIVGVLLVEVNNELIQIYSRKIATDHVILLSVHSLVLILVVMFLLKYQLVDVIKNLVRKLHGITPGSEQRIALTVGHLNDEVGLLESDINELLESVENTLGRERGLRQEVEELERRFRSIFEQTSGGIALIDAGGFLKVHNPAFENIVGSQRMMRLISDQKESLFDVIGDVDNILKNTVTQALQVIEPVTVDIKVIESDVIRWIHCIISKMVDENTDSPYLQIIIQDVSERRNREHSLKVQAELDPLTGLFNRRSGKDKIQKLLDLSQHSESEYALLMIDLDNFKPVNDLYGHQAGDTVLITLAKRLNENVRTDDIIIRWGGDEILIFVRNNNQGLDVSVIAQKLITVIQKPIKLDDKQTASVGASIGISLFPHDGVDLDPLIECADEAMYQVKTQTKNSFKFYQPITALANEVHTGH